MWRKGGKKRYSGEEPSGGDSDGGASVRPSKRPATASSDDGGDGIVVCEISKNRKVSVRSWQGKVVVDIREFYVKDGKECPGRKGISLTMDQWKVLRDHVSDIDEAVNESG